MTEEEEEGGEVGRGRWGGQDSGSILDTLLLLLALL